MLGSIVGDALKGGFLWILLSLDGFIYSAITKLYKVYVLLAGARILTNDAFTTIANQIYIIIGVAMLFVLAYTIICAIINPDTMTKGKRSGTRIIKGVVIAVIGLAITPVLFNLAYQGQDIILKKNVLANLFFSDDEYSWEVQTDSGVEKGKVDAKTALDRAGNIVAIYVWQSFFYPSELNNVDETQIEGVTADYIISPQATSLAAVGCAVGIVAGIAAAIFTLGFGALAVAATLAACTAAAVGGIDNTTKMKEKLTLAEAVAMATNDGDFGIFTIFTENIIDGEITYFYGVSTIVGLFVAYTFLSFSIDMAVRAVKLAYYQIIAPVPLIMQVLPEFEENFNKWKKDVIHTFLEVLIRLSIIYVVVFIIAHLNVLTTSSAQLWANEEVSTSMGFFARLLLIMGLIIFAKMAPKVISETFKLNSADMKLGIGKKLAEGGAFTAAATLGAAATGLVRNFNAEHAKPIDPNTKHKGAARVKRLGMSALSGLAGGLSAGTRVAGGRAWDMAHGKKEPVNPHMAREAARAATEKSSEKKRKRDTYKEEHGGTGWGVIKGKAEDAKDAVVAWAAGPVDTSYQDGQAKLLSDLAGLKSTLEGKINPNDEQYSAAVRAVQDAEKMDVEQMAYNRAVRKEARGELDANVASLATTHAAAMGAMLAKETGETDAAYQKRVADMLAKEDSELTTAQRTARNAFKAAVSGSGREVDFQKLRESAKGTVGKRSEFTIDPNTDEYREAQTELNALRHNADEALKKAKKDAVARALVQASSGQENDISRALGDFFTSHQKEIRTYGRAKFDDSGSIIDFLDQQYGLNPDNGKINLDAVLKQIGESGVGKEAKFEITVDPHGHSKKLSKIVVRADGNTGEHKYELLDDKGVTIETITGQEALEDAIAKRYVGVEMKKTENVTVDADNKTVLVDVPSSATKSRVEQSRDTLVNSKDYVEAHRRQQAQREKEKK